MAKTDLLEAWTPSNIHINGYLGGKMDLCINERIKKQDVQHLIDPFKTRNETRLWQTEFWGKWILSAIDAKIEAEENKKKSKVLIVLFFSLLDYFYNLV